MEKYINNELPLDELESAYEQTLKMVFETINYYPIYGSVHQREAAEFFGRILSENGWHSVVDEYYFRDLSSVPFAQKPHKYNEFYADYLSIPKYNVYAEMDSGKPGTTLILSGHFDIDIVDKNDVSYSFRKAEIINNKLFGRGATDMLSGLCVLASAACFLRNIDWCGKLLFIGVVDEEIGGNGTIRACEYLESKGYLAGNCKCIIAEPSKCQKCTETMGFLPFSMKFTSNVVHMNAQTEDNAMDKLYRALKRIADLTRDPNISINIGKISGGCDASLPMDELIIDGVVAMTSKYSIDSVKEMLRFDEASTIIYAPLQIEPYLCPDHNKEHVLFPSACDATIFGHYSVPTIVWGPGSLEQAHTIDEFIEVDEIKKYISCFGSYIKKEMTHNNTV